MSNSGSIKRYLAFALALVMMTGASAEAQDIFDVVPADSCGYLVLPNISEASEALGRFIGELEIPDAPSDPLAELLEEWGIQPNINGSLALLLLNPSELGIEVTDATEPLPVAIVSASSVEALFEGKEISTDGEYASVVVDGETLTAKAINGFVVFSDKRKAVEAVVNAKAFARSELGEETISMYDGSTVCLNINVANTVKTGMMKALLSHLDMDMSSEVSFVPSDIEDLLVQISSVSIGARMEPKGLLVGATIELEPDSSLAKASSALKPMDASKLMSLADAGSYLLAMDSLQINVPELNQPQSLAATLMQILPKDSAGVAEELAQTMVAMDEQTLSSQFAIQSLPADDIGLINISVITKCQNAQAMVAMLEKLVSQISGLLASSSDPELAQLQMVYKAADSSVEGISVDAIEFQHPMIQGMGAMVIGPVLGELSAKISVTQVDNNTVIVSIGGGERMLAQTIKRVRSNDGSFMSNPAIAEVKQFIPPNTTGLVLINPANIAQLISRAMAAFTGQQIDLTIQSQTPISMATGIRNTTHLVTFYMPIAPVTEFIHAIKTMQSQDGGL